MQLPTIHRFKKQLGLNQKQYIYCFFILCLLGIVLTNLVSVTLGIVVLLIGTVLGYTCYFIDQRALGFSFTSTHLQQHCLSGGWALRWENIQKIDECYYQIQDWQVSMSWIGVALKDPYQLIDSISPKLISQIILQQRQLLYLGLKQSQRLDEYQDLLLKESPIHLKDGRKYKGLQAMLLHRMRIQKQVWGYDLFIAAEDLVDDKKTFIGLTRRYIAANYASHS